MNVSLSVLDKVIRNQEEEKIARNSSVDAFFNFSNLIELLLNIRIRCSKLVVVLYVKSNGGLVSEDDETIIRLPNIGVDASANLFHIVNSYDELSGAAIFCTESVLASSKKPRKYEFTGVIWRMHILSLSTRPACGFAKRKNDCFGVDPKV